MPCALQVTDERPNNTSRMRCNRPVGNNYNCFQEDHLIHRPVHGFPDNRDNPFTVLSLRHCSDWKLAPFSSSRQEVKRTSYLTLGAAATECFELLFPQPTIAYWLDLPNEKNMHDQDISSKPLPNVGSTSGQHRHRKKTKKSSTTCPPCHVVANTSSGPDTAPQGSDSDILHDDDKPPKKSSKKKVNKWKQCRRATSEKLNLLPELPCEEHIDTASPAEVFLPDSLADKLSEASSSSSSLVKDAHLGKDNGESNNEYVKHRSDGKDGSVCAGSSNITVGKRVICKCDPNLNDGPNTAGSSELGGSPDTEHVYSYVGEESNGCQKSSCPCVCNSSDATAASFSKGWNSQNCGDCSTDFEGRLTIEDGKKRDSLQLEAYTCLDSVNKACHVTGVHSEDVTDTSSHSERVQCSSEACSSKTFPPVSPGRSGRKSRNKSSCINMTATNRVVSSNRHKHSGKDSPVSVWQKVEKPDKENSSGAGHAVVSAVEDKSALEDDSKGVQHDPNRPMDKHRCRKTCKQHKKQTPFLYEQTSLSCKKGSCPSPRNYYAPKNGSPKTPKNHLQQTEGLLMLQPVCDRDISDTSITTGTEKATLASYSLGSHLVPQATSKEPCTSVIQDDSHSLCLENKAISTDLDPRNSCVDPCAAEMEETQCVKSYSAAVHMSHKWVPIGKKDIAHLVVEASVPANDGSAAARLRADRLSRRPGKEDDCGCGEIQPNPIQSNPTTTQGKEETMAAYPTRRDDPLSEKRRKAIAWSEEGEVSSPDLFTWVHHPDFLRNDCLEQARRDQESSASGPVKIPTLDRFEPPTRFHTAELFPVRESGSQAVLSAAKFLLGVSSSLDGESLRRCSGFWVGWDEETKTGLVLTSAWLIRTKDAPSGVWSGGQEYAPHAHVTVHLLNGTSAKGDLVYYQPHYDIAFLNVEVGQPIKSPSFCKKDVKFAQEVFQLGRDNSLNLRITYARAEYLNANMFERHHNVYFSSLDGHDDYNNEYDNGGLVIDLNGEVVGMVNNPERFGSFIPSSILLNCLDSWKKYRYIARPHLGMRFEAIKLLEPAHADMLWRMYDIDDGLVVTEVSKGSNAEKCGIQKGDLIECIKGECISTTIQLENLLMSICKGPSDSQNCHNAEVHISVGVFHTLKKYRRIVELTANVSDLGEVIIGRGSKTFS